MFLREKEAVEVALINARCESLGMSLELRLVDSVHFLTSECCIPVVFAVDARGMRKSPNARQKVFAKG